MSDLMETAVIRMPLELAFSDHISQLQYYERANALLEEVETLRAQLKAAQEQEPIGYGACVYWRSMIDPGDCGEGLELYSVEDFDKTDRKTSDENVFPIYAAPVPADHAKEWRGTNEYGLDMGYISGKLGILLRDLDRHTRDEAARVLARLAMVADSRVLSEAEFQPSDHIAEAGKMIKTHDFVTTIVVDGNTISTWDCPLHEPRYVAVNMTAATEALAGHDLAENEKTDVQILLAGYCRMIDRMNLCGYGETEFEAIADLFSKADRVKDDHSVDANKKVVGTLCPEDHTPVSNELIDFLHGKSEFKNCNFGEEARKGHGRFWWRKYLPRGGAQ